MREFDITKKKKMKKVGQKNETVFLGQNKKRTPQKNRRKCFFSPKSVEARSTFINLEIHSAVSPVAVLVFCCFQSHPQLSPAPMVKIQVPSTHFLLTDSSSSFKVLR